MSNVSAYTELDKFSDIPWGEDNQYLDGDYLGKSDEGLVRLTGAVQSPQRTPRYTCTGSRK